MRLFLTTVRLIADPKVENLSGRMAIENELKNKEVDVEIEDRG